MKKILLLAMAVSTLATTTSCSDFLEETNKTAQTADLAYNTKTGIDGLINSCYTFARGWWGKEAGLGLAEMGTDEFYYGNDNKQKSLVCYNFTAQSLDNNAANNPCLDQYWELFYNAVDVCNNAIYYTGNNTNITDNTRQQYLGEAKFLRALYYSQMVALWGPIPYNSEPVKTANTNPVRMPETQVYANILKDIEEAIQHLTTANSKVKTTDGRATLYAAYALKARVALYAASWLGKGSVTGYSDLYQTAQDAAQKVIDESGANFYERYSDVWNLNNEAIKDNKEAIWGVTYDNDFNTSCCVPQQYKTDNDGNYLDYVNLITRVNNRGGSAMSLMFVSLWNNGNSGDLGKSGTTNKSVFNRCTGGTSNFITSAITGKSVEVAPYYSPYGRGFTRYLPSLYLWKTLDGIKTTDQRCEGTLLTHYNVVDGLQQNCKSTYPNMGQHMIAPATAYAADGNYFNAGDTAIYYSALDGNSEEGKALQAYAKGRYRLQFASGGDIPVFTTNDPSTAIPTDTAKAISDVYQDKRYNDVKIGGSYSYPGIKKFLDDQYNPKYPTNDLSYRDFIVFRLPEMYLIKAECQMRNGGDALTTLNQLRVARAIKGQEEANKLKGSVDINTILNERAIELCGEFQRWFDLKRTHKLLERVNAYNAQVSKDLDKKFYYRPIPQIQMDGCTNVIAAPASLNADGVLNYDKQVDGFWQNPGF